jgi:hypothetical protein
MTFPTKHPLEDFPECIHLNISFNEHAVLYQSAEQWIEHTDPTWASPEERTLAIQNDSIWTCQWYPDTPVGFYHMAASRLDVLLTAVRVAIANNPRAGG